MPDPKIVLVAVVLVAIGIAIAASLISAALTPPDPNANKSTEKEIVILSQMKELKSDQFPVSINRMKIIGEPTPEGENMRLTVEGKVKGSDVVKVELVGNDKSTNNPYDNCPCSDVGWLKGDGNNNPLISGENKMTKPIEAGKKMFLRFTTQSQTDQMVSVKVKVDYNIRQVNAE